MEKKPLISVAMATYNGAKFLEEQLDSILNQTYPNIEIIIVDDCSTDNTFEVLEKYANEYSNIQILANKTNKGVNKSFDRAITLCKGDYIAISDQDDIWLPNKLEDSLRKIGQHLLIYSNSLLIDINGNSLNRRLSQKKHLSQGSDLRPFFMYSRTAGHTFLLRAELLKKISPIPRYCHYDRWIAIVAANEGSVGFIEEPYYVKHRKHPNNVTSAMQITSKEEGFNLLKKSIESILEIDNLKYRSFFEELDNIVSIKNLKWKSFRFILFQFKYCKAIYIGSFFSKLNKSRKLNIPHTPQ